MTILSTKAGVKSRLADFLEFTVDTGNYDVMNKQPYGSVTITQLAKGVDYANVQSAIEDIRGFSIHPINTVIINTDGVSPDGVSQSDQWEFSGLVEDDNLAAGADVIILVYGFPVTVKVGNTAEEVANKVRLVLEDAVTADFVISKANVSATAGNILDVTYIDSQQHNLKPFITKGITVTPSLISPNKTGYGSWTRIGTKTETLDGMAQPLLLHYFKRLA